MMEFFAACGRLFNMSFEAAFGLDYFKLLFCFLLLEAGVGLMRLAIGCTKKL